MTHNPPLIVLLDSIRDLSQAYTIMVTPSLDSDWDILPQHDRILDSIRARDEEGTRQAMYKHLGHVRKNHEKYVRLLKKVDNPLEWE